MFVVVMVVVAGSTVEELACVSEPPEDLLMENRLLSSHGVTCVMHL